VLRAAPAAAICRDLQDGTLGTPSDSKLRALIRFQDSFGWPIASGDRLFNLLSPGTLNGIHGAGAVLSAQPQLLSHFGYHSANKGLSIGAVLVRGRWVATSLLLSFKKWDEGPDGTVRSHTRYQNSMFPACAPSLIVCRGPDAGGADCFHVVMSQSKVTGLPIRVLIKYDGRLPPPCVRPGVVSQSSNVYALCLAVVEACHAASNSFTLRATGSP